MRVFLDANVLFTAAHNPDGLSRLLFDLGRHKVLTLISSPLAVDEARANLEEAVTLILEANRELVEEDLKGAEVIREPFTVTR